MQQPTRNREAGQRLTRDELSPVQGLGRMAEAGALATAASALALGTLNAQERQGQAHDAPPEKLVEPQAGVAENGEHHDPGTMEMLARQHMQAPSGEAARLDDGPQASHAGTVDTVWDPSALTARIAEQIASSITHVLDMASGGDGTPQTLSRDIVERAQHIAEEVHGQFTAQEPLAVLADLVPHAIGLDTLGGDIVQSVGETLAGSGVMDLLNGAASVADPDEILDGIVADLHGLKLPVDVGLLVSEPLDAATDIAGSLLGGTDRGENPLADLFYDDGGADAALSGIADAAGGVTDLVTGIPKIGFLGQPLDLGEELGGLTHGHNALQVL
jgi:hypothetical protein